MPESLQQKVDRMTAGMEVTVTFGGGEPGICTGPLIQPYGRRTLTMVGRYVRFADGSPNHRITAIDMPDPECPFEIGARVRVAGHGWVYIVAGWDYYDAWKAWFVRAEVESERESHGLWRPDELTLAPPEPAEPDCPAILVPSQASVLAWVADRWPERTTPIWRAAKLCEEAGEVMGAVIKADEGRKTVEDIRMEVAQVVICAMALAESVGFDIWQAVADECARAGVRPAEYLRGGA